MGTLRRRSYETDVSDRYDRMNEGHPDSWAADRLAENKVWDKARPGRIRLFDSVDVSVGDIALLATGAVLSLVALRLLGIIGQQR